MDYRKEFRVGSHRLRLDKLDPAYKGKHASEAEAKQETENFRQKLAHQQAVLYAEHKHAILVVLQALDAGGKDGTINHVFSALNPQGARVAGFKQPPPPNSPMTSSGACMLTHRAGVRSRFSTARTTRTFW
jgi:polyphosphate kinase 2 (PPK2 family)